MKGELVMKKLILLSVVFILIFVSAALSEESQESFLYGTWARIVEYDSGELYVDLFHVFQDHRAYALSSWVSGAAIDTGPNDVLPWSFEDGKFCLFYNTGYIAAFIPQDEITLKTDEQMPVIYHKIYPIRWN